MRTRKLSGLVILVLVVLVVLVTCANAPGLTSGSNEFVGISLERLQPERPDSSSVENAQTQSDLGIPLPLSKEVSNYLPSPDIHLRATIQVVEMTTEGHADFLRSLGAQANRFRNLVLLGSGIASITLISGMTFVGEQTVTNRGNRSNRRRKSAGLSSRSDFPLPLFTGHQEFKTVLKAYRNLLGLNLTRMSKLLGRGFPISWVSPAERGLKAPPKRGKKSQRFERMVESIVDSLIDTYNIPPGQRNRLAKFVDEDFTEAMKRYVTPKERSQELVAQLFSLVLCGETKFSKEILEIAKTAPSAEECLHDIAAELPHAKETLKLLGKLPGNHDPCG